MKNGGWLFFQKLIIESRQWHLNDTKIKHSTHENRYIIISKQHIFSSEAFKTDIPSRKSKLQILLDCNTSSNQQVRKSKKSLKIYRWRPTKSGIIFKNIVVILEFYNL